MNTVKIPLTINPVSPAESARLLEGIWRARVYVKSCPFRKLLGTAWKRYYKERAKEVEKSTTLI